MDLETVISDSTEKLKAAEAMKNTVNELFEYTKIQTEVLRIIEGLKKAENDFFGYTQPFSGMEISREGLIAFLKLLKDNEYFKANEACSSKGKIDHGTKEVSFLAIYLTLGRGILVELIFRESVKETVVGHSDEIGHYSTTEREVEECFLTARQYTSIEDMRLNLDDEEGVMYFSDSKESVILPFYHPTEELKTFNTMRLSEILSPISTDVLIKRYSDSVIPKDIKELKLQ